MRLFKKIGLFAFMVFLSVGLFTAHNFTSDNANTSMIENNVSTVAKAQHIFDLPKGAAATIDPIEKQALLDSSNYKLEVRNLAYSDLSVYVTAKITTESTEIFSIGYYGEGKNLPAKISFGVIDSNGTKIDGRYEGTIIRDSKANESTTFLSARGYSPEINLNATVEIPYGCTVDPDTVEVSGIYYVLETRTTDADGNLVREKQVFTDHSYTRKGVFRKVMQVNNFEQFAAFTPKTVTKYCGYYAVAFDFNNVLTNDQYIEMIKIISPIFASGNNGKNIQNLEAGLTYVNTAIVLTKNTSNYIVEDLDGNIHTIPAIPANHNTVYGNNNVVFNFPSEGINGVKNFYIDRPMLTINVITKETNREVASSNFSHRFGLVGCGVGEIRNESGTVVKEGHELAPIDADLIAILIFVSITVIFLASCLSMYFYKKKKYADNEFKRVDTPAYIKTSIIAYLYFVIAGLDIYYLIMRCNPLNNSELFANPVDVIVIVFTIAAFLLECFFIKKYYTALKDLIEKNRREKLNLNEKTEEDSGTISAKFVKDDKKSEQTNAEVATSTENTNAN